MSHEQVMLCHDETAGYRAFIAIHSTKLGPAVGGARLWPYASLDGARRVSRHARWAPFSTMKPYRNSELKSSLAPPTISCVKPGTARLCRSAAFSMRSGEQRRKKANPKRVLEATMLIPVQSVGRND